MIWIAILCPVGESAIMRKGRNSRSLPTAISWKKIRLIDRIIQDFRLEKSDVEFREDDQYRCAVCKNG